MVLTDNNQVERNTISNCNSHGMAVGETRNLIQKNVIVDNLQYGIFFSASGSGGHAYRDNVLRGNGSGALVDNSTGTTDEGGNICDGACP